MGHVEGGKEVLLLLTERSHELLMVDGLDYNEADEVTPRRQGGKKSKILDDLRLVKYRQVRRSWKSLALWDLNLDSKIDEAGCCLPCEHMFP